MSHWQIVAERALGSLAGEARMVFPSLDSPTG
jgi:hypothetical protein